MPSSFFGFGTTFYGCREPDSGGTFVTTEWFIICFLPIVPLASYRVAVSDSRTEFDFPILSYSVSYSFRQSVPFNWRQVVNTYLFVYGLIAGTLALLSIVGLTLFAAILLILGLSSGLFAVFRSWRAGRTAPPRTGGYTLGRHEVGLSEPPTRQDPPPPEIIKASSIAEEQQAERFKVVDKRRFRSDSSNSD